MSSKKITRRALLTSMLSLLLCFAMLVGTTFAWFTDSVTSGNNIIKSGILDVELTYSDDNQTWNDASQGAIFNYQYWEPGYTQVKYVKVANVGNLALKYRMSVVPEQTPAAGAVNLADVIDVYVFPADGTVTVDRNYIKGATPLCTLTEMMANVEGAASGILLPENGSDNVTLNPEDQNIAVTGSVSYCIVLKMREEAGNEYQNLSVGEGFRVELLATQYTYENDSFDNQYDKGADSPVAKVTELDIETVRATWGIGGAKEDALPLNVAYAFEPTETKEEGAASPYAKWHADFVVYADKDVPAESLALAGYYSLWCDDLNDERWVALTAGDMIPANTRIRLVEAMGNGAISVNYEEICNYGNDGVGFRCGATDLTGENKGTTLTVELRLYEVEEPSESNGNSWNVEVSPENYVLAGKYSFTF